MKKYSKLFLIFLLFISCDNSKNDDPTLFVISEMNYRGPKLPFFIGNDSLEIKNSIKGNLLDDKGLNYKLIINKEEFNHLKEFINDNSLDYSFYDQDSLAVMTPLIIYIDVYNYNKLLLSRMCIGEECNDYFQQIIDILSQNPSKGARNLIEKLKIRWSFN